MADDERALMEQQQRALEVIQSTTERVTKVETRMESIVVEQSRLASVLEKQTDLLSKIIDEHNATNLNTVAIKERTDAHSRHIEELKIDAKDVSKILEAMKTQLSIMRYVGMVVLSMMAAYFFSHFIK